MGGRKVGLDDMKMAVLITCHNRVATTIKCLRHLFAVRLSDSWSFDVWLNDDGSSDGTGEWVKKEFPLVSVVQGSGHDYWCGGMRRAWDAASRHFDYDGYLWLNDDTMLNSNAFEVMFNRAEQEERVDCERPAENDCILVGAVCGKDGKATYGGEDENGFVVPDGTWRRLRQMNGNAVWVPREVFGRLGNFSEYLTHSFGDSDYSRRAVKEGVGVLLTPRFVATCDRNKNRIPWKDPNTPFLERLRNLHSPLGYSEPSVLFRYCLRHDGIGTAIKCVAGAYFRVLFPALSKRMSERS